MIKKTPFTSGKFIEVWCKHFNTNKATYALNSFKDILFFKPNKLPLYINIGHNLTKGMSYEISKNRHKKDLNKKTYLIYDVPQYFEIDNNVEKTHIKLKKIKQYPGFLINLENYNDFNNYFKSTFSKSSVQKLNRYNRRLETCFNVKEKMLIGEIEKSEYNFVFNHFKELLTKRFDDKKITNNNLNPEEWSFYYDVVYPLILERKAALHVIYNDKTPISVRLLYFSDSVIFDAITVFDIDYAKFHLGKISIMKMLQWSFENDYKIFDFSKGYFDYKESWSDLKYNFEYHLYFDKTSVRACFIAQIISSYFWIKQYLRDKDFNNKVHRLNFFFKNNTDTLTKSSLESINQSTVDYDKDMLIEITMNENKNDFLKKEIYDFLFLNSEHLSNIKVYSIKNQETNQLYLIKGKDNSVLLSKTN